MATPAQIQANRANAQKSTGPRTEEGKARSSGNSLRDGFRSQSVLLPSDDPAAYNDLLAELTGHFEPACLTEQRAVREMADAEWRLRRARLRLEEGYLREYENVRTQFPNLTETELDLRAFENLHRPGAAYPRLMTYEAKFERQYDRAYRSWVQYQKDTGRARSHFLEDQVRAAFAAPLPRRDTQAPAAISGPRPASTNEANFTPSPVQNRTSEPNSATTPAQIRTIEPNSAPNPVLRTRAAGSSVPQPPAASPAGTNEPNSAPAQTPRSAPCPCGSGQKFKRCCGRHAPPVLFPGVHAA
jgi:hypothetical protein